MYIQGYQVLHCNFYIQGYLGQVLHCNYGHSVLGLEGKQGHTTGADKRTQKFGKCSSLFCRKSKVNVIVRSSSLLWSYKKFNVVHYS